MYYYIQTYYLATFASFMSLYAYMFGICAHSYTALWAYKGRLDGH